MFTRLALLSVLTLPLASAQPSQVGQWTSLTSWPFVPISLAHLSDGRIVAWSSTRPTTFPAGETFSYAAVYDPTTGQITSLNNTAHDMFCAGLASTGDGRIIASGGGADVRTTSTFGIIPKYAQSWARLGDMLSGRWYNSSITLPSGNLMTMWGRSGGTLTETFNQNTNTWSALSGISLNSTNDPNDNVDDDNQWFPHFHLMPNGKILMAGPLKTIRWLDFNGVGSSVDIGFRTPDANRHRKLGASVQFLPGKILFTGGRDDRYSPSVWNSAIVIDATSGTPVATTTGNMNYARAFQNLVILPNGEVMVLGGNTSGIKFSDSGGVTVPEIWNPTTGLWRTVAAQAVPRGYHVAAVLLRDGRVMISGGGLCGCSADHPDSQIYSPTYLFNVDNTPAPRPTIDLAAADLKPGQTFGLKGSDNIIGFRLIRLQATTHGINSDQRYVPVNHTKISTGNYNLTLDSNQSVLPPGMYWLFALTASGTPSIGYPIQMHTPSTWPGGVAGETNLAKGKPATQSSTDTNSAVATRAVDDKTNGDYFQNSVAVTASQSQPYWQVDLGASAFLTSVRLWNRTDCCTNLLSNFHVFLSGQPFTGTTVAQSQAQPGVVDVAYPGIAPTSTTLALNRSARYVRVQLEGTSTLQLAEVEIFGSVITNFPPVVSLSSPANGATFTAPISLNLTANSTDPENNLARVEFYNGATKLGEDSTSPYSLAWNNVPAGSYSLTARAFDAAGLFTNSTAVNITVNPAPPANVAPIVSFAAPVNGAIFPSPASVSFTVNASDPDGNLARVEFYNGAVKLAESSAAPFLFSADNLGPGTYTFTARAVDSAGLLANANLAVRVLSRQLQSLKSVPVPEPTTLTSFVKNRAAAIALGKAFFWDTQLSSDSAIACATCHLHAGSDSRIKNQANPGTFRTGSPTQTFENSRTGSPNGPNYTLKRADFPRHVLSNPADPNSTVVYQTKDVIGSHGVFLRDYTAVGFAPAEDSCASVADPVFGAFRRATGRNTPSVINSVFNLRNFWDGSANTNFNGVDSFGPRNTAAVIYRGAVPAPVAVNLDNASLASQALTPALNSGEMSCNGRTWPEVGRRLAAAIPLSRQTVLPTDSVHGTYASASGKGLNNTYTQLIQAAFQDDLHASATPISINGRNYSQLQANFSLFFGLAVQLYQATLVSDQAPIDNYFAPYPATTVANAAALSPEALTGLNVFTGKGRCLTCHHGPQLSNAATPAREASAFGALVSYMRNRNGDPVAYDLGYYNLGVRPTGEDLGTGGLDPFGNSLSLSRQVKSGVIKDSIATDACTFEVTPCVPLAPSARDAADGAFKTPSLRNVSLTGPYFHNGSAASLEEVVEFYNRGGNATGSIGTDSSGFAGTTSNLHTDIRPLGLAEFEKTALVAFLKTALLDDRVLYERAPFDHPELPLVSGPEVILLPAVGSAGRPQPLPTFEDILNTPTIALSVPATTFTAPATIPLTAITTGTLSKVEFFNGATLLATITTAPYTYNWTNVPAGAFSTTAKATATNALTATTPPITITVTAAPAGPVLAGRWPLDAVAANQTADISGNNNNGLVTGSYSLVPGTIGQALKLDPNTGGVLTQRSVIDPTKSFTVSVWVNLTNTSGTQTFVSLPATSVSNFYLQLAGWYHDGFMLDMYSADSISAAESIAPSTTIPVPNRWYHVAAVYNATTQQLSLYVDGRRESQVSASAGTFANPKPLAFGYSLYGGARTDGNDARIDDIRVYASALSDADITTVFNGASAVPSPTIALSVPATTFTAPAIIPLTATTTGPITQVEFFNGATLLATITTAPYTYNWTNVPVGTYSATAKVNGTITTAPTTITVSAAPTIALSVPATTFTAPATIPLTATTAGPITCGGPQKLDTKMVIA